MNVSLFGFESLSPKERTKIKGAVLAGLGVKSRRNGEICLVLLNDKKIQTINKKYLGHDYATDVISFPYEDILPGKRRPADAPFGDIYLGSGVAKRQAKEMGHPLFDELLTLAIHGALHLVGYDDRDPAEKKRMFKRQDSLVKRLLSSGKKKTRKPA